MTPSTRSRYIFVREGNWRTFLHKHFVNGLEVNCDSCLNRVEADEPYSHHWMDNLDATYITLSASEKLLLNRIEREGIVSYLLCDESATPRTNDFLLEAGMEAVPRLLRFLYYEATRLEIAIGFYMNVRRKRMYYETCTVNITNHLDIDPTVDMLFSLLIEKMSNYTLLLERCSLEACTIKRLRLTVKRYSNRYEGPQLPLQYRVKCDARRSFQQNYGSVDLEFLTKSYLSYEGKRFGCFPKYLQVNLYCFRVCASTKELYAVPYFLSSDNANNAPTFLIQNDVTGAFQGMYEIKNIRRFLRTDLKDHTFVCRRCECHFAENAQFWLHKQINCGQGFIVSQLKEEGPEIHENCLVLPRQYFKHAWFGLSK